MKEYPSILSANDLLARSDEYLGRPFVAFDKLDGSNIRAEWDRKKGWHRFGSRRRLLDSSQPFLGQAIRLILDGYGDGLAKAFRDDPALRGPPEATCYFEFLGPHSFAGQHDPAALGVPANEPFRVVLLDVNLHKRGFVSAEEFVERFGPLGIPRVVHRGELTRGFIEEVRRGKFGTGEGVVCKGGEGHRRWMAKVKTDAYLQRLRAFFQDDWRLYWE
jgi:RNA ligase